MIETSKLLDKIDTKDFCGVDLRLDNSSNSIYHKTKDLRTEARNNERQDIDGETNGITREIWKKIYDSCVDILINKSKDLEVCTWLIEAAIRLYGLPGFIHGYSLTSELIKDHWDECFPLSDEDGDEIKVIGFSGLNGIDKPGTLITPIANILITNGKSNEPHASWQYVQATLQSDNDLLSEIYFAANDTDKSFYTQLTADLALAKETFKDFNSVLESRCGDLAPHSSNIFNALTQLEEQIIFILNNTNHSLESIQEDEVNVKSLPNKDISALEHTNTSIETREQAFKTLSEIAIYFEKSEPHSPLPYLLKRAIKWGNLSLPSLLQELINSEDVRNSVFELTGIEHKQEKL